MSRAKCTWDAVVDVDGYNVYLKGPIISNTHSLTFDGIDDYIDVGSAPELNVIDNFTLIGSIKPTISTRSYLFYRGTTTNSTIQYSMFIANDDNFVRLHTPSGNFDWSISELSNDWHNISLTVDGNGNAELFINYVSQGTNAGVTITSVSGAQNTFGRRYPDDFHWEGGIDELQIWGKVLSQAEIEEYGQESLIGNEDGLLGYWNFNEGEGSIAIDGTGSNNGTISGATYSTDTPFSIVEGEFIKQNTSLITSTEYTILDIVNGVYEAYVTAEKNGVESAPSNIVEFNVGPIPNTHSLSFDGIDDNVLVNDITEGLTQITIEANVKLNSLTGINAIVAKWYNGNGTPQSILMRVNEGALQFYIRTGDEVNPVTNGGNIGISVPSTEWVHLAVIYDGSEFRGYMNAVVGTTPIVESGLVIASEGEDLRFGGDPDNTSMDLLDGLIDEVRIWNTVRTQQEIQDNMGISINSNENGLIGYWRFNEGSGNIAEDKTVNGNNGTINGATYSTDTPF